MISVVVLAVQYARVSIRLRLRNTGDVDEESVPNVNPPRINNVHPISSHSLPDPWIDIEQVLALHGTVVRLVLMRCHVVFVAHHRKSISRHLYIDIPVPR